MGPYAADWQTSRKDSPNPTAIDHYSLAALTSSVASGLYWSFLHMGTTVQPGESIP